MLQRSWRESRKVSPAANFLAAANFSSRWGGKLAVGGEELFPPILASSWAAYFTIRLIFFLLNKAYGCYFAELIVVA